MKKILLAAAAIFALAIGANAQPVESVQNYSEFAGIDVSNNFEVKISYGETFQVKTLVEDLISQYVQMYVKSGILYITLDEKSYSKEVKAALKGKNAIVPILRAEVQFPSISSMKFSGKTVAYATDNIKSDVIKIELEDNAVIKSMSLDGQDVRIKMSNKTNATFDIYCNELEIEGANNAVATLALNATKLNVGTAGSATVNVNGDFKQVETKSQGSSVITLQGNSSKLVVDGSASSYVHAESLDVKEGEVVLANSAKCDINAKDKLKVDLTGSSTLTFDSNPSVDVTRIIGSTMVRPNTKKKK